MATHGGKQHTPGANGPGRVALRSLSAAVVVGFSVFAFGFQAPPASQVQSPAGAIDGAAIRVVPPSGNVGPSLLDPDVPAQGHAVTGPVAELVAKVPFGRITVETSPRSVTVAGKSRAQSPGVASSTLRRPGQASSWRPSRY